ncbi:hypothetical protein HAX54_000466, partial [Datura stramonium]|nr:hypothetical protein [Datura stramonium]
NLVVGNDDGYQWLSVMVDSGGGICDVYYRKLLESLDERLSFWDGKTTGRVRAAISVIICNNGISVETGPLRQSEVCHSDQSDSSRVHHSEDLITTAGPSY